MFHLPPLILTNFIPSPMIPPFIITLGLFFLATTTPPLEVAHFIGPGFSTVSLQGRQHREGPHPRLFFALPSQASRCLDRAGPGGRGPGKNIYCIDDQHPKLVCIDHRRVRIFSAGSRRGAGQRGESLRSLT